ncbi:helix-turn-helix domain-containing protein [Trichothermofontia sp.]
MSKRSKMRKSGFHLKEEQATQLAAIGAYLAEVRQQQALSLQDVASRTLVQVRLLQAIEEGRLEALPEPVYIKGFIRRFAEVLGLEGASLAQQFPTGEMIRSEGHRFTWRQWPVAQLRPVHLYLLYIFVIVCAVNSLSSLVNPPIGQTGQTPLPMEAIPPSERPASGPVEPAAAAQSTTRQRTTAEPRPVVQAEPSKPLRVRVTLVSQSWIRVVADGQTAFEGVLQSGANQQWAANQQLVVRAGDAGAVLLSFNDGKDERLGEPGAVEEVVFESEAQTASLPTHLQL